LDTVDLYLWNLFQALCVDGEQIMSTFSTDELLLLAIFVFGLMCLGLILTVKEFKKAESKQSE